MPSQFSAIGFEVATGDDLASLASSVADRAETLNVAEGQYLKWAPPSGEQLWLQVKRNGDAMGMNPHFAGRSVVRAGLETRIVRERQTPLDGTFIAWANPPAGAMTGGDYPFAFDCPDAAVHDHLELPALVTLQVAAFAQQVTLYASEADYDEARQREGLNFASRAFIPSGLISPNGEPVDPPEPHALFVGHVVEANLRRNTVTGHPYWWALVETIGGTFDVVMDPSLVPHPPLSGHVLSGWFWLSGRIRQDQPTRSGWLSRLTGRT